MFIRKPDNLLPWIDRRSLHSFLKTHGLILLLLLFCAPIFIGTAFTPAVADDADAIHAVAAREILQRHDWVTLYVNGVRYLQKAPMLYWLVANAYQVFGFNAFATRLPTLVSVLLLVGVIYGFGRWAFSQKAGLYAAVIMSSSVGIFLFTRIMIPEALLTLLLTIGHCCFLLAYLANRRRLYYGFYAMMALAVLTKGLIGIVFAAVPVVLFLLITRSARWHELKLLSGLALFLTIALPWHLLAGLRNEHFFWYYFVNEHFLRFFGERYPKDYNKLPFLNYWLLHLVWLFPWSLGLPLLGRSFSLKCLLKPQDVAASVSLYLWLWAGVILIFFSLSTSQEYYTFPAYPALALLLGTVFARADVQQQRFLRWMNGVLAAIGVLTGLVLGYLVWTAHRVQTSDFSALLDQNQAESEQYTFSLGHLLDLTPQAFAALEVPAIAAALALSIGFLLAFWWRWHQQHGRAVAVMVLTMGLLFICAHRAHEQFEPILSSRFMADEIVQRWQPNAKIVLNRSFEAGGSIAFYTDQRVLLLNGRTLVMEFGSQYPDVPPVFIDNQQIRQLWQGDDRVFLFTETVRKGELLKNLGLPVIPIVEKADKSLFMNH